MGGGGLFYKAAHKVTNDFTHFFNMKSQIGMPKVFPDILKSMAVFPIILINL